MENLYIDEIIKFEDGRVVEFLKDLEGLKEIHKSNMIDFCRMINALKNIFVGYDSEQYLSCADHLSIFRVKDKYNNSYNYYEFCEKVLHLDKGYVCKLNRITIKFLSYNGVAGDTLKCFSISKLAELLPLPINEIVRLISAGHLSPSMTKKQIRELVKSINGKASEDEESEEDIPFAFDPKQVYEFQYFDGLSKNQLVNIAMSYQNYIHKAKNG